MVLGIQMHVLKHFRLRTVLSIYKKIVHTCDKFQRGIREVFLSFPGGF